MQKVAIIGADSDCAELAAALSERGLIHKPMRAHGCSDRLQPLYVPCPSEEMEYVGHLLDARTDVVGRHPMQLIVGNAGMAASVGRLLAERGEQNVEVVVSEYGYHKTREEDYWTPAMCEAKEASWRAQQPRHSSQFTKSQPSPKARKAARRRAKAGRKSSR